MASATSPVTSPAPAPASLTTPPALLTVAEALRRPGPSYVSLCAALVGLPIWFYLFAPMGFESPSRDLWHHVAVLGALIADPFGPSNPHVPTNEPSRYFTPTALTAALLARLFGLSAHAALGVTGAASCVALCVGVWVFARRYFESAWAPHLLLLVMLYAWGRPSGHVGFHNLATLLSSAGYPAFQAVGIGLFCLAATVGALGASHRLALRAGILASLCILLVLTHQLTGVLVLGGAGGLALFWGDAAPRRRLWVVAAMGAGAAASLAWPYFDVWQVVTSVSDERWRTPAAQRDQLSYQVLMALPALIGLLALRSGGRFRYELTLPIFVFGATWLTLAAAHHPIAHRIYPGVVLYGQIGLVWLLLRHGNRLLAERVRPFVLVAAAIFLVTSSFGAARPRLAEPGIRSAQGSLIAAHAALSARVPDDAVAFASEDAVYPYQATGRRVVSIPRPEPAAPSLPERQAATDAFFAPDATRAERLTLMETWCARYVVFAVGDVNAATRARIEALGTARTFGRGLILVEVRP